MNGEDFCSQLSKLAANDENGLSSLAKAIIQDAREAPDSAVRVWKQGGQLSRQAMMIVAQLGDLALIPLISAGDPIAVSQVIWSLRTQTAILADMQARVVRHIDALLGDVRRLPMRVDLGPSDERIPPVRVCDEAYLQMCRLLSVEESAADYVASSRGFLNLPEDDKDAQILQARKSAAWIRLGAGK
ncbi:MAG: hypothetical protein U0Q18_20770 [Bryobacteraceae bacterium]